MPASERRSCRSYSNYVKPDENALLALQQSRRFDNVSEYITCSQPYVIAEWLSIVKCVEIIWWWIHVLSDFFPELCIKLEEQNLLSFHSKFVVTITVVS